MIFFITFIVTAIVSMCFFKKRTWENRYLIIAITGIASLVLSLVYNYSVRNKLNKDVIINQITDDDKIMSMVLEDTLFENRTFSYIKNVDLSKFTFKSTPKIDTTKVDSSKSEKIKKRTVTYAFYVIDGKKHIGVILGDNEKITTFDFDEIYFAPSKSDSIAYLCVKRLEYDIKDKKFLTIISYPTIKTIKVLNIPPSEYKLIPDSLIQKLPF